MNDQTLPPETPWPRWIKTLASLLIVFHIICVFTGPWAVQPPPASELSQSVAWVLSPYLKFMSLDNGYRYFAPDPMPGHILKYRLLKNGNEIATGEYPDRKQHWPRQFYHRYFMVSETAFQLASSTPASVPPEAQLTSSEREQLAKRQAFVRAFLQGIADNLLTEYPEADAVQLTTTTHAIPTPSDMAQGIKLTDERLYHDQPLGEFTRSDQ
ncbi:MAG: hypothetical protein AAF497_13670 [Planctomycetota bacterium]